MKSGPGQILGWACIYVLRLLVCQSPLGHARAHSSHNLLQCLYLAVAGAGQETDRWYQAGPGRCRVYPGAGESGQCQLCRAQVRSGVTTLPVDAGGAMFSHNNHVCR